MATVGHETQWVRCPAGVFELRFGRRAVLHVGGNKIESHTFKNADIRDYSHRRVLGWRHVSADRAQQIIEDAIIAGVVYGSQRKNPKIKAHRKGEP